MRGRGDLLLGRTEGSKTLPGGWHLCQRPTGPLAPSPQALSPQLRRSPEVKHKQETLLIPKQGVQAAEHVRGSPSQASLPAGRLAPGGHLSRRQSPRQGTHDARGEGTPRPFPLEGGCRSSTPHTASSPRLGAHAARWLPGRGQSHPCHLGRGHKLGDAASSAPLAELEPGTSSALKPVV